MLSLRIVCVCVLCVCRRRVFQAWRALQGPGWLTLLCGTRGEHSRVSTVGDVLRAVAEYDGMDPPCTSVRQRLSPSGLLQEFDFKMRAGCLVHTA